MEPTPRLFLCLRCQQQVILCSWCDRGQVYCSKACAQIARQKSLRLARLRYQQTPNGKRNHAACQARYRRKLKNKVMDHGSPPAPQHVPMFSLENKPEEPKNKQKESTLCCYFCEKSVSDWIRNDFLRRRGHQSAIKFWSCAQAP